MSSARKQRLRRTFILAPLTLLVAGGGYTVATLTAPLPEVQAALTEPASNTIAGDEALLEATVAGQSLPTAVGWQEGDEVWANTEDAFPIASMTKLITVLVCLEAQPVEPGTDGDTYTVGNMDAVIRAQVLTQDGIVNDTPVGLELTTRQLLQLILLPSSNNYAISYANSIFGSQQKFAAAANDWAKRQGLATLNITEASGLSEKNVASPADMLRVARLALDDPLIAETVALDSAEIPEIGLIETTNPLAEEPGIIGLKTGTLFESGYNLAAARETSVDGRDVTTLTVTLSRESAEDRAADTREVLAEATETVADIGLFDTDASVGAVLTWEGVSVPIITADGASTVLIPGESAEWSTALAAGLSIDAALPGGSPVGTITVTSPGGDSEVPLVTASPITEPDGWWRLGHPGIVFGWVDPERVS